VLRIPGAEAIAGALAAYLAWSLLDFDWAPATAPFWLLAGAALAGSLPELRGVVRRTWVSAGAVAAVLLGLLCSVPPVIADTAAYAGRDQLAVAVDPLEAQYHAALKTPAQLAEAGRLGSDDPQVWVQLGNDAARRGDLTAARRCYRRALAIYPYDGPALAALRALR
jgi:tetratricopeptide (TPR) repeat protein